MVELLRNLFLYVFHEGEQNGGLILLCNKCCYFRNLRLDET